MKANPKYRGKWYAPMIDNPAYKGEWAPRKIPNPGYFEDLTPVKSLKPIVSWQSQNFLNQMTKSSSRRVALASSSGR